MRRINPYLLLLPLAVAMAVAFVSMRDDGARRSSAADARAAASRSGEKPPPAPPPFGTVRGTEPLSRLTLRRLRRTGPRVVTATLSVALDRASDHRWLPELAGRDGTWWTAEGLRLVDEVNGREHFPLEDGAGDCLCSTDIGTMDPGETVQIYAKFPAPPATVTRMSLHTPSFPSFDDVPLER